jgi:hypothetical protein
MEAEELELRVLHHVAGVAVLAAEAVVAAAALLLLAPCMLAYDGPGVQIGGHKDGDGTHLDVAALALQLAKFHEVLLLPARGDQASVVVAHHLIHRRGHRCFYYCFESRARG